MFWRLRVDILFFHYLAWLFCSTFYVSVFCFFYGMRDNKTPNEGNKSLLPLTFLQSFSLLGFFFVFTLISNSNFKLLLFFFLLKTTSTFSFCLHIRKTKGLQNGFTYFSVDSMAEKKKELLFNVIQNVRKKHLRTFILFSSLSHSRCAPQGRWVIAFQRKIKHCCFIIISMMEKRTENIFYAFLCRALLITFFLLYMNISWVRGISGKQQRESSPGFPLLPHLFFIYLGLSEFWWSFPCFAISLMFLYLETNVRKHCSNSNYVKLRKTVVFHRNKNPNK